MGKLISANVQVIWLDTDYSEIFSNVWAVDCWISL